jgi:Magnesium chelatase, subunit ChlI
MEAEIAETPCFPVSVRRGWARLENRWPVHGWAATPAAEAGAQVSRNPVISLVRRAGMYPVSGKSMLAQRLPTILPPLTPAESLETTRVYSAMGRLPADQCPGQRAPGNTTGRQ